LTFTYDSSFRLVAVTDALGQVTTLDYLDPLDPLRLTKVTDPFARYATLTYDAGGRLASITDVVGLTSSFVYSTADFITAMTTPYGTTAFHSESAGANRVMEVTDPAGGRERLEFRFSESLLPATVPSNEVPAGFSASNVDMHKYLSLYWDKQAMATAPGDLASATITHWLLGVEPAMVHGFSRNIPHAIKRPLETRVWYQYPNQSPTSPRYAGNGTLPSKVARLLEDGTTQLTATTYNAQQQVTSRIDPLGRTTTYTYAANGLDLLEVRQVNGGTTDLLASYSNYNTRHLPASLTDAAGQSTTFTYNAAGQVLTVTNAKNEATTYTYEPVTGRLLTVTGPVTGSTTTYSYDGLGRVRTVTEPDGYAVTTDYDALDRVTKRTYPDTTYEEITYARLDVSRERDRSARITQHFYDGAGRRTATRDPLGRLIQQDWCACGSLRALVDGNGNRTTWERDVRGRVTREVRADNVTDTLYTYDATGRLQTVTDPKDQVTTHTYAADDSLLSTTYTNAQIPTPGVTYTYDPVYPRVATMVDGIGTTTYTYKAPGQLGAGQVASVDGPLTDDTITYASDELGRVTSRAIDGAANTVTWTFDALGRVAQEANLLGTFTYNYDGVTSRVASVTYPNNQTSTYSYLPTNQDHRLQTIHHKYPNGTTLSKFDYTYDAVGNIQTWRQQADSTAVLWKYGYDTADQLTAAVKESTDPTPQVLKRYAYAYDPAGNRTMEQIDDAPVLATHDNLNRLLTHAPGGPMVFSGTVNEPATVTIQGKPATVDAANSFRGTAPTVVGTTTATIVATDPSGNVTTKQWEVDVAGTGKTFTYDANGNLTADGTRTFEWDARNQLAAVTVGTHRSEFTYDGHQRRVRMVEKENSVVQSDTKVLWCQTVICEERASDGTTVTRRAFAEGEQVGGTARYFATDHLGSVTELTDGSATVLTRYAFDPWGARAVTTGTDLTDVGFTGHDWTANGSVWLTMYRAYDPALGRWLSDDPVGLDDGPNMAAYVRNRPTVNWDSLGLQHLPGGPWHPEPPFDQVRCTPADSCPELQRKISTLSDMIRAHRNWDKKRGTNRHADEIADLTRAITRCVDIYNSKDCKACNGNENCQKMLMVVGAVLMWVCLKVPVPAFP
jgi:RHS repeat-associated protein